jgi:hypothetical protein
MKNPLTLLIFLLIMITIVSASCSSSNRIGGSSKKCGCGLNKGMVGY